MKLPVVGFYLYMPTDFEILIGSMIECKKQNIPIKVFLAEGIHLKIPDSINRLKELGIFYLIDWNPFWLSRIRGRMGIPWPALKGIDFLVTAVETNLAAHNLGHRITKKARVSGIRSYTWQHGFENVGINYKDSLSENVKFASDKVLIWGKPSSLSSWLDLAERQKMISAGYPKIGSFQSPQKFDSDWQGFKIGVFENLHWHRYDENYRAQFLKGIELLLRSDVSIKVYLKPHYSKLFKNRFQDLQKHFHTRFEIVDNELTQWKGIFTSEFIKGLDLVYTCPSTIALDASVIGKPVVVINTDLDLSLYKPLCLATSPQDWVSALNNWKKSSKAFQDLAAEFCQKTLAGSNGSEVFVQQLLQDWSGKGGFGQSNANR